MKNTCLVYKPRWCRLATWWPLLAWVLAGCSLDSGQQRVVVLPTGHYEGMLSYQGAELRAVLDLRESQPGQLEADVQFPDLAGLNFVAANLTYAEPQLRLEEAVQPGGIRITAIREGDFLRGVFTLDSIRTDFVWVRRGQPEPRSYQETQVPAGSGTPALTLFVPNDTLTHPGMALFADASQQAAATGRARQLAEQGFVTTVAAATASPDSSALRAAAGVLQALRRAPGVDSTRVGLWARGTVAATVAAAALLGPRAAFVVLESVPVTSADQVKPFQALSRQRLPVLLLYAAADTSLNAKDSARRLRNALGSRRRTLVRTFPRANANFRVPGELSADGKWTWPHPAPGYLEAVREWRN